MACSAASFKDELHLALAQHGGLIGGDETRGLDELPHAGGPAIEQAQLERDYWQVRHADEIDDSHQEEIPVGLLPDLFAQERALQIRQNSGRVHQVMVLRLCLAAGL